MRSIALTVESFTRCPHCDGTGYEPEFSLQGLHISQPCCLCGGGGNSSPAALCAVTSVDISHTSYA